MIDFHGYGPRLAAGAAVTAELAVAALALAFIVGLLLAGARLARAAPLRWLATGYVNVMRGVPPLVMMMLCFYGGQLALNRLFAALDAELGVDWFVSINPFVAGIVTLGLIYAAYMSESFRGAFLAVEAGQIEAARAFGMSGWQVFRRVRFPLMMRHALPGIANNWMVLLKDTALVSIIGLSGMVRIAGEATKDTHQPFLFMLPVGVVYLLMTSVSEIVIGRLRRRYDVGFESRR